MGSVNLEATPVRLVRTEMLAGALILFLVPVSLAAGPCDTPDHRAFDFLVGSWEIRQDDGELVGTNTVTLEMGGCVIHESYRSVSGTVGESFSTYDPARGGWHQTWVDNEGRLIRLDGDLGDDGVMRLTQVSDNRADRFTWEPLEPGVLRQTWQHAPSAGGPWEAGFSARWSRIGPEAPGTDAGTGLVEAMAPLRHWLGVWTVTPIEQVDGEWTPRPGLPTEFRTALGGNAIVTAPTSSLRVGWVSSIETFSYDPFQKVYRLTWHDSLAGLLDVYEGTIEGSVLRVDNLSTGTFWTTPDEVTYAFRLEYDLEPVDGRRDSRVYASRDGGETWSLYQRTEYRRVEPD